MSYRLCSFYWVDNLHRLLYKTVPYNSGAISYSSYPVSSVPSVYSQHSSHCASFGLCHCSAQTTLWLPITLQINSEFLLPSLTSSSATLLLIYLLQLPWSAYCSTYPLPSGFAQAGPFAWKTFLSCLSVIYSFIFFRSLFKYHILIKDFLVTLSKISNSTHIYAHVLVSYLKTSKFHTSLCCSFSLSYNRI